LKVVGLLFFLLPVIIGATEKDPERQCSEELEHISNFSNYIKTRTGAYFIGANGVMQFIPKDEKAKPINKATNFDPSHKAILERSLGKNVVAEAMAMGDPNQTLRKAFVNKDDNFGSTKRRVAVRSFVAITKNIPRDAEFSDEFKQKFFEILESEGRIYKNHYEFLKQYLADANITIEDSLGVLIKFAILKIDLGNGAWQDLTVYGYSHERKEPEIIHYVSIYRVQELIGESRAPISLITKGFLGIMKDTGSVDVELVEGTQTSVVRHGVVVSVKGR